MRIKFVLLTLLALWCVPLLTLSTAKAEEAQPPAPNAETRPERKEYREEMKQLRADHEALQADREKLLASCAGAKDQEKIACEKQFKDLRLKQKELHERRVALHEKIHEEHKHSSGEDKHGAPANGEKENHSAEE